MNNNDLHIYNADTIAQYKIVAQILKDYGYTDESVFLIDYELVKLSNTSIKIINKKTNDKVVYTYDNDNKEISKKDVL